MTDDNGDDFREIDPSNDREHEPDRGNPLTSELEDDGQSDEAELQEIHPNIYRQCAIIFTDRIFSIACCVMSYKGNKQFAFECVLAAQGGRFWSVLGVKDQDALADRWGCTKANVSKLVKKFQGPGYLNMPPMPGQRTLAGCANMKASRKKQLNNTTI